MQVWYVIISHLFNSSKDAYLNILSFHFLGNRTMPTYVYIMSCRCIHDVMSHLFGSVIVAFHGKWTCLMGLQYCMYFYTLKIS